MSPTCSTIFAATLVISSSIQAMLTLNKTLFCTGLLLTQSNPSKWNSVKGSFIWICLQLKTMQSLSETPTWVMNWQLFLNNPNIDKWKRLRVKKSKLFTEQRHDKYIQAAWHKSFSHCGKIQVWADQKSRRSEQMQQIFVFVIRNIFPCGFYSISETKGPSTTNNWGDNAGLWGSESLSAWSNILWSALVFGKF